MYNLAKSVLTIFVSIYLIDASVNFGRSVYFHFLPCTGRNVRDILRARPVRQSRQRWLLRCARSCELDTQCDYAIFRQSAQLCSHISYTSYTFLPDTPAVKAIGCSILRKSRKLECQNGGTNLTYTCQCPRNVTGRECEETVCKHCQEGAWRPANADDFEKLGKSRRQMKLMKYNEKDLGIFPITFFMPFEPSGYRLLSSDILSVDGPQNGLKKPLKKLNIYFSTQSKEFDSYEIDTTGTTVKYEMSAQGDKPFDCLIRDSNDTSPFVYEHGVSGSVDGLMNGLSQGHRLLHRGFTRVGFDKHSKNVYYESTRAQLGSNENILLQPLYYFAYKKTLKTEQKFISRRMLPTGNTWYSNVAPDTEPWELDRCWVKVSPLLEHDEFTNVLKEMILGGRDIRLVLGEAVSTDVTMVTITTNDIIASLAEYLTPFDSSSPLNETSRIRFSLISRSNILSECEKEFLRSTVCQQSSEEYENEISWIASSRPWRMIFTMISGGQAIYGSSLDVYEAVIQGRNVRVCIEQEVNSLWMCCGGTNVIGYRSTNEVLLQTPPVMNEAVHKNGTFAGMKGADCKFNVMLISTGGWIEMATYNPGIEFSQSDVVNMTFATVTWFEEL